MVGESGLEVKSRDTSNLSGGTKICIRFISNLRVSKRKIAKSNPAKSGIAKSMIAKSKIA